MVSITRVRVGGFGGLFVLLLAACVAGCAAPKESRRPAETSADSKREARPADDREEAALASAPAGGEAAEPAPESVSAKKEEATTLDFHDDTVGGSLERPAEPAPGKARPRGAPKHRPSSAGVKAGAADDNLQFNAFLTFLEEHANLGIACDVSERIVVAVRDKNGLPLADARVTVVDGEKTLVERRTYADGRCMVFPSQDPALAAQSARLVVRRGKAIARRPLNASGKHSLEITLPQERPAYQQVPLDVVFVLDTTGSMGDEIQRLKQTLEYIHFQITHLTPRPDVRFGMVLFRDKGDSYRTRVVPLTPDLEEFAGALGEVRAGGGGDTPEDVQAALEAAMTGIDWRKDGVKLAFLIGDAPPHLDYGQTYTYVEAMQEAARRGIKITTIGASGLDRRGELVWRQLAQYTMAPFVFLTYGESGDSEGSPSSVSHHVGSNWVAENLDAIVVRMIKVELSHYAASGAPPREDFFVADHRPEQRSDDVLQDLFSQSIRQLVDYCVFRIEPRTPTVVLPVKSDTRKLGATAERLHRRLALSLGRTPSFQLVEAGEDLPRLLETISRQFSRKYDDKKVAELGKLVPAKLAVFSQVDRAKSGRVEMLIKLVRLETGEILSLSLLRIDRKLLAPGS